MRLLINHNREDSPYRINLIHLLKPHGLTGVASTKTYGIQEILDEASKVKADAILLQHTDTLKALLGEGATLDKYRGTRINYSTPVIVANPTEHIHTVTYGKFILESDLRKFKRIREPVQSFNYLLVDNDETRSIALAFLEGCFLISFDIETDDKRQITCISFTGINSHAEVKTYVVPLVDFSDLHYGNLEEFTSALLFIQQIQKLPAHKLAWNGIYDSQYCITYNAEPHNFTLDGMILAWSRYSELPRYLDFQASLHCYDYFQWKDEADAAKKNKDIRSLWGYCGKDSWYTLRIFLSLLTQLEDYQVFNYRETFPLVYPSLYVAFEGLKVNNVKRLESRKAFAAKMEKNLKDLQTITCNPTFNPGSWQQVGSFIYDVIGAKRISKEGGGTSSKILNRVAMQHPLLANICDRIITYREDVKAIGQYHDFTQLFDRLLYNIDPTGAETGRAASKASSFWVGTQIQNIPPYAKEYLEADDGYTLVEADKNKSEARCVGYNSQCEGLITALEDSRRDFYKVVSEMFFGVPWDQVTPEMRNDVTKHIIHGTHHVMGPQPFIDTATPRRVYNAMKIVNTPYRDIEAFVKYLLSLYHKRFPEVRQYWKRDVSDVIAISNKTVSPLGWTRYFFGDIQKNHSVFRSAVAHQSQNLSVHIINREMLQIYYQLVLKSNGEFRLKAQIHDSIFAQVLTSKLDHYVPQMEALMKTEVQVHKRKMKIPVDIKVGKTWGKMEKYKLPSASA